MGPVKCKPPCLYALFSSALNSNLTFKGFFQAAFLLMDLQITPNCLPGKGIAWHRFQKGQLLPLGSEVQSRECKACEELYLQVWLLRCWSAFLPRVHEAGCSYHYPPEWSMKSFFAWPLTCPSIGSASSNDLMTVCFFLYALVSICVHAALSNWPFRVI